MTVYLSAFAGAGAQFFTDDGEVLSGGKIFTYAAGTTTPQTTSSISWSLLLRPWTCLCHADAYPTPWL